MYGFRLSETSCQQNNLITLTRRSWPLARSVVIACLHPLHPREGLPATLSVFSYVCRMAGFPEQQDGVGVHEYVLDWLRLLIRENSEKTTVLQNMQRSMDHNAKKQDHILAGVKLLLAHQDRYAALDNLRCLFHNRLPMIQ